MFVLIVLAMTQLLFRPFSLDKERSVTPAVDHTETEQKSSAIETGTVSEPILKTPQEINEALRREIVRKRKEADELETRKHVAFLKWWQMPQWCMEEKGRRSAPFIIVTVSRITPSD